jgi:hypothetical protein
MLMPMTFQKMTVGGRSVVGFNTEYVTYLTKGDGMRHEKTTLYLAALGLISNRTTQPIGHVPTGRYIDLLQALQRNGFGNEIPQRIERAILGRLALERIIVSDDKIEWFDDDTKLTPEQKQRLHDQMSRI